MPLYLIIKLGAIGDVAMASITWLRSSENRNLSASDRGGGGASRHCWNQRGLWMKSLLPTKKLSCTAACYKRFLLSGLFCASWVNANLTFA